MINKFVLFSQAHGNTTRVPPQLDGQSEAMSMKTRQSTQLRRLALRTLDQPKPIINIDAATRRGLGRHKEKFNNYLGIHHRLTTPHLSLKDMLSGSWHAQSDMDKWHLKWHKKYLIKLWVCVLHIIAITCFFINNNDLIWWLSIWCLIKDSLEEQTT